MDKLRAPFPWFGGKSRVAHVVWDRFGDVPNYVEPFAGSLATLLLRPHTPGTETVNDLDCFLANFWRATSIDPDAVASHADYPVNEADLHARHRWLVAQAEFRERMLSDPDFFDPKIAGWWVWGISQWIGSGWCGVEAISRKRPHLGNKGCGVHRLSLQEDDRAPIRKLPHLGDAGRGSHRASIPSLRQYFRQLRDRLRFTRVCCGEWSRILGPSPTTKLGLTAVFLDPPYSADRESLYSEESFTVAKDVHAWAIENGDNPLMRIAVCGYEGEHDFPVSWECVPWKATGGYGNKSRSDTRGRDNARRERVWFSPHCLRPTQQSLFGESK